MRMAEPLPSTPVTGWAAVLLHCEAHSEASSPATPHPLITTTGSGTVARHRPGAWGGQVWGTMDTQAMCAMCCLGFDGTAVTQALAG